MIVSMAALRRSLIGRLLHSTFRENFGRAVSEKLSSAPLVFKRVQLRVLFFG